jgi:hypothetical protein
MARQIISTGTAANDGTGDTLRSGAVKINTNFAEIYEFLGADSDALSTQVRLEDSAVVFEGVAADSHETRLIATGATADREINLPNASGNVVLDTMTQTLTNKTLTTPIITSISNSGTVTVPSGADTLVARTSTDTLTNKTLTAPTVTGFPKISKGFGLADSAGDEVVVFDLVTAAAAANMVTITNAVATSPPIVSATGSDTNVSLKLIAKGTGAVLLERTAFNSSTITANGAMSATVPYIIANKGSALALTLANGTVVGEYKVVTNKGAGIATITPASFANGTTIALDQYDAATLIWDGTNWYTAGHYGATVA